MHDFSDLLKRPVVILDGGLGTTLEDVFHKDISHTPLWSTMPVKDDPACIVQAHLAFLRAGARIITTATYQSSQGTFELAGYSGDDAKANMMKAVRLAHEARTRFLTERPDVDASDVQIALSLGPFGATQVPGQEYDGFYPPPYGPKAYSKIGGNYNVFAEDQQVEEARAVDALVAFHFQRILVFARDEELWKLVHCVAFETIPLLTEVKAIRKTMDLIHKVFAVSGEGVEMKPWWISLVFPDGQYPQQERSLDRKVTVRKAAETVLKDKFEEDGPSILVPSAFGINCTSIEHVPRLVREVEGVMRSLDQNGREKPWLVIYPNGGQSYDPLAKKWIAGKGSGSRSWSEELSQFVRETSLSDVWSGILVGGCCKTTPDDIRALSDSLKGR